MKKDGREVESIYLGEKEYKELSDSTNLKLNKFMGIDIFKVSEDNHFNIISGKPEYWDMTKWQNQKNGR